MKRYADHPQYDRSRARALATAAGLRGNSKWTAPLRYIHAFPASFRNRQQRRAMDRDHRITQNRRRRAMLADRYQRLGRRMPPRRRRRT